MKITRSDRSNMALWWWTIDRYMLTCFFTLIIFGIFLVMASSQHLAESLNISSHHFTIRHLLYGSLSIPIIIFFSILNEKQIKVFCILGLLICISLLLFILIEGERIKGAQRWFYIGGFSFQPSEVCKPFFVIFKAFCSFFTLSFKTNFFLSSFSENLIKIVLIQFSCFVELDLCFCS